MAGKRGLIDLLIGGIESVRDLRTLDLNDGFTTTLDGKGRVTVDVASAVALRDVWFNRSAGESQTTSTGWTQKVRLDFTAPADRTFLVISYCECSSDQNEFGIDLRLQLDDDTTRGEVEDYQPGNATGWGSMMLFDAIENPSEGSHHLDLDFAANTMNKNVRIRRARIWLLQYIKHN